MAKIEDYVVPHCLYRYRSLENFDREINCIEEGYLYCAPYRDMNDPMEGYYGSSKLLEKNDHLRSVRDAIFHGKESIRICSFSEAFTHELMWAHYANRYNGICIAYDFYNLRKYLPDEVTFSRIYYNEEGPVVGYTRQPRDIARTAKMVLSYKNYRWLYEREWRMFAEDKKVFYHEPRCVVRVYIGSEVSPVPMENIKRRLKELKIPCQVQKLDGYKMLFEKDKKTAEK